MEKVLIAVGGGSIREKTTLEIDRVMAELAKKHAGDRRANVLFFGTASHDSMPYFNSFRKTYTSVFDVKAECALIVYGEMDVDKIAEKIDKADGIYIGGGDTMFLINKWRETGIDKLIINAYNKGVPIIGLSAGAICWFSDVFTDTEIMNGNSDEHKLYKGLGVFNNLITPHYNERREEFKSVFLSSKFETAYAVENDAGIYFVDGKAVKTISAGGKAYIIKKENGEVLEEEI